MDAKELIGRFIVCKKGLRDLCFLQPFSIRLHYFFFSFEVKLHEFFAIMTGMGVFSDYAQLLVLKKRWSTRYDDL